MTIVSFVWSSGLITVRRYTSERVAAAAATWALNHGVVAALRGRYCLPYGAWQQGPPR